MTIERLPKPLFLYGTAWKEDRTAALTRQALDAGFRGIDTANQRKHYFEAGVGEAVGAFLEEGRATRADLFLQTKFTHLDGQDHRLPYDARAPLGEQVLQSFESSLLHLRTTYLDSLILHGPTRRDRLSDEDWAVWEAMCGLKRAGKTHSIGVSNVSLTQVREVCGSEIKPAFVQNRCYARTGWDREIRAVCREQGVVYQGFSLLTANAREMNHEAIQRIARGHRRTPAQIVFRFALQVGMCPLTGTSSVQHLREDLGASAFELSASEVDAIEAVAER
jgi:diketogulonate reductase-like aldo/keto reductase